MASAISHAIAAVGISACFYDSRVPKGVWVAGVLCAVSPDIDVIGFRFGVHYGDFWGHRGFTHSIAFAILLATALLLTVFRKRMPGLPYFALWLYLFLATISHGVLDAMTDGGLGVAFFSPFDNHRYFLPWTPIRVSPIGVSRFFSTRGLLVLESEFFWIWIPTVVIVILATASRKLAARKHDEPA
jgi:inner membrane protein